MSTGVFILHSAYTPSGDQPDAIARLIAGIDAGATHRTLKGITGSGKTFTMANIIHRLKRPALILAPNKTLTAQLYDEMKQFFPENAVEYFVSYYDYFQPEVYLPGSDRLIEKDSSINEHLERLRLSTTKSLLERRDTIVIASVSSIYGLGAPQDYRALQVPLAPGAALALDDLVRRLQALQYERAERSLKRGTYRITSSVVDIFPADAERNAVRLRLAGGKIDLLQWIDPATGHVLGDIERYLVSPKTLFSPPSSRVDAAAEQIVAELNQRVDQLSRENRLAQADRLYERVMSDVDMLRQQGWCPGIENYAGYLSGRDPALPPITLLDYLPKDGLLFVDESHVMVPQIAAMYRGDQSRKDTLIDYGFRLPSSKGNHPLSFAEFEAIKPQTIFVSATPGEYEIKVSKTHVVEQIVRPTGLLDPQVEVRPSASAMDDLLLQMRKVVDAGDRVLVTTLTKAGAEKLHRFIESHGFRARWLHSDVKTAERAEIINGLRAGEFDVLIGISLLREGLDIPEAALVAILDADRAGFLRGTSALVQMIGRVARNVNGRAILYADSVTPAMKQAMDETERRRRRQLAYNEEHQVTPVSSARKLASESTDDAEPAVHSARFCENLSVLCKQITEEERELLAVSEAGDESRIQSIRQELDGLYRQFIYV